MHYRKGWLCGPTNRTTAVRAQRSHVTSRIRDRIDDHDQGFTLIEVLVVIIIIGILATVAIPIFLSQRQKSYGASAKSDLSIVAEEIEAYNVDNQAYPVTKSPLLTTATASSGGVTAISGTLAKGDTVSTSSGNTFSYYRGTSGDDYCIIGVNAKGANNWEYQSANGGLQPASTANAGTTLQKANKKSCTSTK
jgi:type IV pilus assembly protein PilA